MKHGKGAHQPGLHAELGGPRDRLTAIKEEYERSGSGRSNLRYGYIAKA